jgi:hypothetical protein
MEAFGLYAEPRVSDLFREEKMKKTLVAVLAIYAALFTLGLLGCDNASSSSDNDDSLFNPKPRGELIIINLDSTLYGSLVYICDSDSEINPASQYRAKSSTPVTNASEAIVLNSTAGSRWNGTDYYYVYLVKNSIVAAIDSTNFSNGNGIISSLDPAGLTLTGVNSSLYGSSVYICSSSSDNPESNYLASSSNTSIDSSTIRINLYPINSNSLWDGTNTFYVYLVKGSNKTEARQITFVNGSASINLSNVTLSSSSN